MYNKEYLLFLLPFPISEVQWRVGSTTFDKKKAQMLGYIDSRQVMERLDAVAGNFNWQTDISKQGDTYLCSLSVYRTIKTDGAGATNVEGEKGGVSDAIKRAAVQFGIGRYLYDLSGVWVPQQQKGDKWYPDKDSPEYQSATHRAIVNVSKAVIKRVLDSIDSKEMLTAICEHDIFKQSLVGWNSSDKQEIVNRYKELQTALGV
jgi:hypothetical protein